MATAMQSLGIQLAPISAFVRSMSLDTQTSTTGSSTASQDSTATSLKAKEDSSSATRMVVQREARVPNSTSPGSSDGHDLLGGASNDVENLSMTEVNQSNSVSRKFEGWSQGASSQTTKAESAAPLSLLGCSSEDIKPLSRQLLTSGTTGEHSFLREHSGSHNNATNANSIVASTSNTASGSCWNWSGPHRRYYRYAVDANGNYLQDTNGMFESMATTFHCMKALLTTPGQYIYIWADDQPGSALQTQV